MYVLCTFMYMVYIINQRYQDNDVGRATLFTNTTNTIAAATTTTATPVVNIEKHEISLKESNSQNENKSDVSLGKLGSVYNYCTHI